MAMPVRIPFPSKELDRTGTGSVVAPPGPNELQKLQFVERALFRLFGSLTSCDSRYLEARHLPLRSRLEENGGGNTN